VANILESTEMRNIAITEVQFGQYFKHPERIYDKAFVPLATKLIEKPFFSKFCKEVEVR
jgi:hypothetical protein